VLFAAAKPGIYWRNDQNGKWRTLYTYPIRYSFDQTKYASGFRALTCIDNGAGKKNVLLTGFEGTSGDILRIDAETGAATTDLQTRDFLSQQWGAPAARRDIIPAYNDIPLVRNNNVRLFGLLAFSPLPNERNSAWFLSRTMEQTPRYELHEVRPPQSWSNGRSDTALWSVRAIAVSPFPEDNGQVLYLGGYDGHFQADHNTAWLDRVGVNTALRPYRRSEQRSYQDDATTNWQ
jgi:hypothetical protein